MDRNDISPTRRTLLGAAVALPAILIATTPTLASANSELAALIDAFRRADYAEAAFAEQVYLPAEEAWRKACAAIPHVTLEPDPYTGRRYPISTADEHAVMEARRSTRGRYWIDPQYPDAVAHYDLMENLKAAADAREAEKVRLSLAYRVDEFEARSEALYQAADAAFDAVLAYPVKTAAELADKLALIDQTGRHEAPKCWAAILRDSRALAQGRA